MRVNDLIRKPLLGLKKKERILQFSTKHIVLENSFHFINE